MFRASGMTLPITALKANPDQPRRAFNDDAIDELADSIKARGLLQPILVRPRTDGDYEIVAGRTPLAGGAEGAAARCASFNP